MRLARGSEGQIRTDQSRRTRILQALPDFVTHAGQHIVVDLLVNHEILVAREERNVVRLTNDMLLVSAAAMETVSRSPRNSVIRAPRACVYVLASDADPLNDARRERLEARDQGQEAVDIDPLVMQQVEGAIAQEVSHLEWRRVCSSSTMAASEQADPPPPVPIALDLEPMPVPPIRRHAEPFHELDAVLDVALCALVGRPARVTNGADRATFLRQAQVGVVGAERDAVFGARREHAV